MFFPRSLWEKGNTDPVSIRPFVVSALSVPDTRNPSQISIRFGTHLVIVRADIPAMQHEAVHAALPLVKLLQTMSLILEKLTRQEGLASIEVMTSRGEISLLTQPLASDQLTEKETVLQNRGSEPGMSSCRPSFPIHIKFVV